MRCITIPPYSPQLNAAEKVIAVIKNRLKQQWISSKVPSLSLVKEIIDEVSQETCKR